MANPLMNPQTQFLLQTGASLAGRPYSPVPQGTFGGLGNAMSQGMNAYQNALILQQERQEYEDQKKAAEAEAKQRAEMAEQFQKTVTQLPPDQAAALMNQYMIDPKGAFETLWKLKEPEKPTTTMRNREAALAQLEELGLLDHLSTDQKASLFGVAMPPAPPMQYPQVTNVFDPETGRTETVVGPPGIPGAGGTPAGSGAKAVAGASQDASDVNADREQQDQIGSLIYSPVMEKAVGPGSLAEKVTGKDYLTNSPEYQLRADLAQVVEPEVLKLGAKVLKGSQTEKEWEMVRNTIPKVTDSVEVWRSWYQRYMKVKMAIENDPEARDYMRREAGKKMSSAPMSFEQAEMWLNVGDKFIGPDGKEYEVIEDGN